MAFQDRRAAGRLLARDLEFLRGSAETIVLALPRGGVPVGFEIAHELNLPLDILLVRKLGVPGHEELAMGAVASGGTVVLNMPVIEEHSISRGSFDRVLKRETAELDRRQREYRVGLPALEIAGRTVLLVDDGLATGASMRAAARAIRGSVSRLIIAAPVGEKSVCEELQHEADQLICPARPRPFVAVGLAYRDFRATTDGEVVALLAERRNELTRSAVPS